MKSAALLFMLCVLWYNSGRLVYGGENVPDNKTKNVAKNNNDKIQRSGIDKLIRKIRTSDNHDDVSIELYATMMFNAKAKPPYHKWVATWILKCIKETFPSEPYCKNEYLLYSRTD